MAPNQEDKWERLANHVPFSAYNDTPQAACLDGTREKLLTDIMQHLDQRSRSVIWLHGAVGTGKTAVALSIVERLKARGRLAGRFFFSRKDTRRQSLNCVLPTIAYQLGVGHHRAREQVIGNLTNDPGLLNQERSFVEHLLPLFIEPLRSIKAAWERNIASTHAFVFDGVDECCPPHEYADVICFFRSLLNALSRDDMPYFHIFLTSRADLPFRHALAVLDTNNSHVIDIHDYDAEPDILRFMKSHLTEIAARSVPLPMAWPSEQEISMITKRAAGQFIFAATVVHFVAEGDAPRRLASVLRHDSNNRESTIYDLYRLILDQSESQSGQRHPCSHLAVICCLSQPVFPRQLGQLMEMRNPLEQLQDFPSLVVVPRSQDDLVEARHSTLREFFTSNSYSRTHHVGAQECHGRLAHRCFVLMNTELKRDFLDLEDPNDPARLNARIHRFKETRDNRLCSSSALYYACMYWVDHFVLSKGHTLTSLDLQAQRFFQSCIIYWIEAMAALHKLGLALRMLRTASKAIEGWPWDEPRQTPALQLLYDAERLVQEFRPVMSSSVMSLYHSALPFIPRDSALRQTFGTDVGQSQVRMQQGLIPQWSPRTLSINVVASLPSQNPSTTANNILVGVAVSPDGTRLVSWLRDGRLHMWDTLTGSEIESLPFTAPFSSTCRHKRSVHYENAITFSPDGTSILLASRQGVWLWGIAGKHDESPTLLRLGDNSSQKGGNNSGSGLCCGISADGKKGPVIAVGTTSSILIWRKSLNQPWQQSASHHNGDDSCTIAVSITACGQWILTSACSDITVCLMQTDTMAAVRELSLGRSPPPTLHLLCHFFLDDGHAIVVWSSQSEHWLLVTSPISSSKGFAGRLIESSQLEPTSSSAWSMFLSRPKPTQLPFGLKSVTPLYFDGRPTVVQIKDQLFTRSGLRLIAWSPSKAPASGSYVRVGTISGDKRCIHLWDPSISVEPASASAFDTTDMARQLNIFGTHGERLVTATTFCGSAISNVTISDISRADSYGTRPFPTETFTFFAASRDLGSFVCSSRSHSSTLRSSRFKSHRDLNAPYPLSDMGYMRSASFSPDGSVIAGLYQGCVVVWREKDRRIERLGVVRGCFNTVVFSYDGSSVCCVNDRQVHVQRFAVNGQEPCTTVILPESNFVCATFSGVDANVVYTVEAVYQGSAVSNKFQLSACKHIIGNGSQLKKPLISTVVHCLSVTEVPAANGPIAEVSSRLRAKGNFTFSPERSLLVLHSGNHYYETIRLFDTAEANPFEHVPSGSTVDVESWSDFSLRNSGWIYKGSRTMCWVPPAYRPHASDVGNVGLGKGSVFKVLGKNKVVLVQQHDFVVLHFPHVGS